MTATGRTSFRAYPCTPPKTFEAKLDHRNISVGLGIDFHEMRERVQATHLVYAGPIEAYFGYRFGRLPYRSLRFEHEHLPDIPRCQPVATVSYPNEHDYIRVTEFKHLTGQEHTGTTIVREYPQAGRSMLSGSASRERGSVQAVPMPGRPRENVTFVGRLSQYRYNNMDQVVGAALKAAQDILG